MACAHACSTASFAVLVSAYEHQPWYLPEESLGFGPWVQYVFTYFLLAASLIPISFYVTRNLIFGFARYFLVSDLMLYDEQQGEPARVRAMHLMDELGQASYMHGRVASVTC